MASIRYRRLKNILFVLACLIFSAAGPSLAATFDKTDPFSDPAFRAPYLVSVDAYDAGDYVTALKGFKPLSEQGDFRAQIYLGTMYQKGLGLSADLVSAAKWFHQAANGALAAFYEQRRHAEEWRRALSARAAAMQSLEQRIRTLEAALNNIRRQLPPGNLQPGPSTPQ